ncbi:MAG: two-component regulator propeller domain-containing protein [Pseudomonadota bacterium]
MQGIWPRTLVAAGNLLLSTVLWAAETPPMRFDVLSVDQGLSQNAVLSIIQDQSGHMWFGTEDGLDRYNGLEFAQFRNNPGEPQSLPSDFILDLALDGSGRLWLATDGGGLVSWDPQAEKFAAFSATSGGAPDARLRSLHFGPRGHLWVASRDKGLYRVDPASGVTQHFLEQPDEPASLASNQVFDITSFAGLIWVATERGLNQIDPAAGTVSRVNIDAGARCNSALRRLEVTRDGTLWLASRGGGLCAWDPATGNLEQFLSDPDRDTSLASNRVSALLEDPQGRLWIGTEDAGLNLLLDRKAGRFRRFRHDSSTSYGLSDNTIVSLFADHAGVLWVGTKHGGVNKWNPRTWSFGHEPARAKDGYLAANITSFAEDPQGNFWIGSIGGGVTRVERVTGRGAPLATALPAVELADQRVMSLLASSSGQLWVGTMTGGLHRVDPESGATRNWQHAPEDPTSISANGIMALHEDAAGNLWVGTYGGGVSRYLADADRFERHLPDDSSEEALSGDRATALAGSPDGTLWVGTDGGGLNIRRPGADRWEHLRHNANVPGSLGSDTIYSLFVSPKGLVWVGTRSGLNRLEPATGEMRRWSMADGMPNDSVYAIVPDTLGNLWLSTNRGLSQFNPDTGRFTNYNRSHGLQGDEFNFGAWYRSSRGELFFGGANGYNRFFPGTLARNTQAPRVVLTGLEVLNRPVQTLSPLSQLSSIELAHTDSVVAFEFAALDYSAPDKNLYRYRLRGFDPVWSEARGLTRATYTNLDSGSYQFEVIAANSDGVWNSEALQIDVAVEPPPWRTLQAYLVYSLAALALLLTGWRTYRHRRRQEAAFLKRLTEEVEARTSELAQRNTELKAANDSLELATFTDPLTQLRNRRFVSSFVEQEAAQILREHADAQRDGKTCDDTLAFVMVDLDHFKPINDQYGHAAGDRILIKIAEILEASCRNSDFVARWGGDEFIVIGRHKNAAETAKLADRIRRGINDQIYSIGNGRVAHTTSSIGFACYPFMPEQPTRLTWEQVLAVADSALYRAKYWRNAAVGYFPTRETCSVDNLLPAIEKNSEQLARDGLLVIDENTGKERASLSIA